ncbi:MAG: hypothetical protein ACJ8IQ_07550 [Chthoniobacterales bacterium]
MDATLVYRVLLGIRACWLVVEWFFIWGAHLNTFTLTHPYATLIADAIALALWLVMLSGMWFFQRWARLIFVLLLAVAVLTIPWRVHRYSLSAPPSFVPLIGACMLLVTGAILAMSFLPPVRDHFTTNEA